MEVSERREIGRQVAEARRERRQLLGPEQIRRELAEIDEHVLGRRRLASEQRRYTRLLDELAAAEAALSNPEEQS